LAAVAGDPSVIVVASAIGGVGYALFLIGGVTYVSEHVPPELAATAQGIFQGISISLSGVLAAASAGLVAGTIGIQGMFLAATVVGAAGVVVIAIATRPSSVSDVSTRPA
jgi:MFS family permease